MANLTITIDDEILNRARIRAQTEQTSLNDVLLKFLESYAGTSTAEQAAAVRELIELSRQIKSRHVGKRWSREELHERK